MILLIVCQALYSAFSMYYIILIFTANLEVDTVIIPILQMQKQMRKLNPVGVRALDFRALALMVVSSRWCFFLSGQWEWQENSHSHY